jgi:hypothetical protein
VPSSSLPSLSPSYVRIFFSAICSQTPSICSSLTLRDQISHLPIFVTSCFLR